MTDTPTPPLAPLLTMSEADYDPVTHMPRDIKARLAKAPVNRAAFWFNTAEALKEECDVQRAEVVRLTEALAAETQRRDKAERDLAACRAQQEPTMTDHPLDTALLLRALADLATLPDLIAPDCPVVPLPDIRVLIANLHAGRVSYDADGTLVYDYTPHATRR